MKILQLKTQGFGCLAGQMEFQPTGVNLWIAENAQGKSTLAIAIREALYGPVHLDRRRKEQQELVSLEPLKGEAFDIRLDVEVKGQPFCIFRDFAARQVRVLEGGIHGKDVTDEFRVSKSQFEIGKTLLGLTREDFIKSVFVGQGEVSKVREATALTGALQRIADVETGHSTVANAVEVLDEAVQRYPLRRSGEVKLETEKGRLQDDLEDTCSQIKEIEKKRDSIKDRLQELAALEEKIEKLRSRRKQVVYLEKKAELKEIEQRVCDDDKQRESVAQLEEEFEEIEAYATFPLAQQQKLHRCLDDIKGTKEDIEKLNGNRSEKKEELERFESQLKKMASKANFTQQDRDALLGVANRLEDFERTEAGAGCKVEEERQQLEIQSIEPHRYEKLSGKFESLTSEERQFLRNVSSERQNRKLRKKQQEERQDSASNTIHEIESKRDKRRKTGGMLLVSGGGLLSIGLVVAFVATVVIGAGVAGIGLIVGLSGIILRQTASSLREEELATAKGEKQDASKALGQIQQLLEQETKRLEKLANKVGLSDKDVLESEYIEFENLSQETEEFRTLMHDYEKAKAQTNGLKQEACHWLERVDWSDRKVNSSTLKELLKEVDCALTLKIKRDTAKHEVEQLDKEIDQKEKHLKETNTAVKKLLKKAELDEDLENKKAREEFDKGVKKAQRRHRLEEEILPKERKRLMEEQERTKLSNRVQELQQQMKQAAAGPGGGQLAALMVEKDRADYQRVREDLNDQIECKQSRVNTLESEIGDTRKEVRENLPKLLQEREDMERLLRRAEQFEAAVSIAKGTLERLASEVYEEWAEALNTFAADAFEEILPYYHDPRFDQNLHFTFVLPEHPGRIDPTTEPGTAPRLSAGELEQIHLVARLAIADYLSKGDVRPPIILDEPFPYSHDEPFSAGMQLLANLSQQRQVIVLTCHEVRHRWLLKQLPELEKVVHEVRFEGASGPPLADIEEQARLGF